MKRLHDGLVVLLCGYGAVLFFFALYPPVEFSVGPAELKVGGDKSTPRLFIALWLLWAGVRFRLGREVLPVMPRRAVLWSSAALFGLVYAAYLGNNLVLRGGDSMPAQLLSVSLLRHGSIYFDWLLPLIERQPYWLVHVDGHYLSSFPLGTGFLVLPVHVLAAIVSPQFGQLEYMQRLEKTSAAIVAALAVVLFFHFMRAYTSKKKALFLAFLLGFGTNLWVTGSQNLWQHGASALCLVAALLLYSHAGERREAAWLLGWPMVLALFCRPLNVLWIVPLGILAGLRYPRRTVAGALLALPLLLFAGWIHFHYYGHVLGSYAIHGEGRSWQTPLAYGLAANLVSPGRGVVVYTPMVLFAVAGAFCGLRRPELRGLTLAAVAAIVAYLMVISKFSHWWGGYCYGPRFQTELMPLYVFLLFPALPHLAGHRCRLSLFVGAVTVSVLMQSAGAFSRAVHDWSRYRDIDRHPERLWDWNQPQWLAWWQQKPESVPVAGKREISGR